MLSENKRHQRKYLTTRDMTLIALFAVLMIVGGKINLMVFSIPFTFQFQACLLTGLLLGAKRALLAQGIYIMLGLIGLPVFALGGGIGYVLQPSFGYLPGMMLAAGLTGWLADKADPAFRLLPAWKTGLINLGGLLVVYLCGVSYLYAIQNLYAGQQLLFLRAVQLGMIPFLITDLLHCLLAAVIAPRLRRAARPYLLRSRGEQTVGQKHLV